MRKTILFILTILIPVSIYSQNAIEEWDKNYRITDVIKLLDSEKKYAEKVESDPDEGQYYIAMESIRFIAEFTGNIRVLNDESLRSMKNVLKIKTGNSAVLNNLVSKEMEFKIDDISIWMGIQNQLIDPFIEEVKKGEKVLLYTIFTNEHKFEGGYINSFLISEFSATWEN
jgi:hypothetical protein